MKSCFCNRGLLVLLLGFLLLPNPLWGQISWQTLHSSTSYDNRDEHGYAEVNGKFYLIGGAYMGRPNVQVYDPVSNSWTNKAPVPEDFHHLQAVSHNGLIWVMCAWKGAYQAEQNMAYVYAYDPVADSWAQRFTVPSNRRRGSAGVIVHNNKFYIIGGNSGGHGPQGDVKNWLDVYDPNANGGTGSWTTLANMPVGRDHFQAVAHNGKIYAIGGRDSGVSGNFFATIRSQVDVYDIASNSWSTLPGSSNLPTLRAGTCNILMDDEILVMLGVGNARENEFTTVEAFNLTTHSWRNLPQAPHARSGTQAVPFGRDIYVASGIGSVYGGTDLYQQDKFHIPLPGNIPPSISAPEDVVTMEGNDAVFSVQLSGGTNLSCQWQRMDAQQGWQPIPGANQATYTLFGVTQADDSSLFRMEVTHSLGISYSDSALLSIRCNGVFLGNTDPIVMEAENFHHNIARNGQSWQIVSQSGAQGQLLEAGPNTGANYNTNYMGQSPETQYDINFSQSGTYYIWLRIYSPTYEDNSCHAALDSIVTGSCDRITYDTYQQWGWSNATMDGQRATFVVPAAGIHRLHLWVREDGIRVDRILLTQNSAYTPTGPGPLENNVCSTASAFPIDLGDWQAVEADGKVQLSWTTLSEQNNAWFVIEKSEDQQIWLTSAEVPGAGNSSEPKSYFSTDTEPWLGRSYYRLKQVDFDGNYSYSHTLALSFENFYSNTLETFPNPLSDGNLHVRFSHDGQATLLILRNLVGAEIQTFSFTQERAGIQEQVIHLENMQSGIYLLQLKNKYFNKSRKVIIP